MGRTCSTNGEKRNASYRILVRKPEGKRPPGRSRHRWMDNIKIYKYLREMGSDGMAWIDRLRIGTSGGLL
jgi:hypothetical protein